MESKLNLFDVFGYLVPGCVVCALGLLLAYRLELVTGDVTTGAALALLPLGYVVGFVSYHIVTWAEHLYVRTRRFIRKQLKCDESLLASQRLLDDGAGSFTEEFRAKLKEELRTRFDVQVRNATEYQQAFDLCYDFVIQKGVGAYTENFRAVDGLCKNLIGVGLICVAVFVVLFVRGDSYAKFFVVEACVGGLVCFIGMYGHIRFAKRFAISVYRSFYVWSRVTGK